MPQQRLTAYTVGRFLLSILATSATAAPRERPYSMAVCVQPMEAVHTGQRPRRAYARRATGVSMAILATFLRPWHCYTAPVFTPVFGALQRLIRAYPARPVSAYIAGRYAKTRPIAPKHCNRKTAAPQPVCAIARSREPENPIVRAKVVKSTAPGRIFLP